MGVQRGGPWNRLESPSLDGTQHPASHAQLQRQRTTGHSPLKDWGTDFHDRVPPATALLSRAGTQISIAPQPGSTRSSPWSSPRCSQISPPKSLSKLTGYKLCIPFSCYSSLAGHPSQQLLPRTHASDAALEGWAEAGGAILGARRGKRGIVRSHTRRLLSHKRQGRQREHSLRNKRSRELCHCRAG